VCVSVFQQINQFASSRTLEREKDGMPYISIRWATDLGDGMGQWVEMIGGRNGLMMENHPATWGMTKPSPGLMDESVAGKIHG
jgi:hypothetical protein